MSRVAGTNTSATFANNSGTVRLQRCRRPGTYHGGNAFNNLTHSGAGTLTLNDTLTVNGALIDSAGIISTPMDSWQRARA